MNRERKNLARERRMQWSRASSAHSQNSDRSRPSTSGAVGAIDRLLSLAGEEERERASERETERKREREAPFASSELPNPRQWAGIFTPKRGNRSKSQSQGGGGGWTSRSGQRPRSRALAVALSNLYEGDGDDGCVIVTEANMQEMWRFSQLSTPQRPPTSVSASG